jgi:hypothetical protein
MKTVEKHLRKVVESHQKDWDARLPIFLLAYRAFTHDTTGLAPDSLVFRKELRLLCDLLFGALLLLEANSLEIQSKGNICHWKPLPEDWWRHSRLRRVKCVL